jgi:hypothetical protein
MLRRSVVFLPQRHKVDDAKQSLSPLRQPPKGRRTQSFVHFVDNLLSAVCFKKLVHVV